MRKVLFASASLGLLALLFGYFLPSGWRVERSIVIAAPAAKVFPLVQSLHAWPSWALPAGLDLQPAFSGNDGEVGSIMRWAGGGRIDLTAIEPGRSVSYDLRYSERETRPAAQGKLALEGQGERTTVIWTDAGSMGHNPLARYFISRVERDVSNDMEQGLVRLQARAEGK